MTKPDLAGTFYKIERAKQHAADLERRIKELLDDGGYSFASGFHADTGEYFLTVHNPPTINPLWSLLVGEIVYQLRSALDHLAWQLVIFDGQAPCRRTSFPIRDRRHGEPANTTPPLANKTIIGELERCQPYNDPPEKVRQHPLSLLRNLNNIDKHRLLLVVAAVFAGRNMYWAEYPGLPMPQRIRMHAGVLTDGMEVAWFNFGGIRPPDNFDVHPGLEIGLAEITPNRPLTPITGVLEHLCWFVEWEVARRFQEHMPLPGENPDG
jgi:hypothetical protein